MPRRCSNLAGDLGKPRPRPPDKACPDVSIGHAGWRSLRQSRDQRTDLRVAQVKSRKIELKS